MFEYLIQNGAYSEHGEGLQYKSVPRNQTNSEKTFRLFYPFLPATQTLPST